MEKMDLVMYKRQEVDNGAPELEPGTLGYVYTADDDRNFLIKFLDTEDKPYHHKYRVYSERFYFDIRNFEIITDGRPDVPNPE